MWHFFAPWPAPTLSQLWEATRNSRAETPSDVFGGIYETFKTHIKIFIPQLALRVYGAQSRNSLQNPSVSLMVLAEAAKIAAEVNGVGPLQDARLSATTAIALLSIAS